METTHYTQVESRRVSQHGLQRCSTLGSGAGETHKGEHRKDMKGKKNNSEINTAQTLYIQEIIHYI